MHAGTVCWCDFLLTSYIPTRNPGRVSAYQSLGVVMLCFALRCLRGITEPSMAKSDLLGLMTISGALSVLHGYRVMNGVTLSQRTLKLFSALTLICYVGYTQA